MRLNAALRLINFALIVLLLVVVGRSPDTGRADAAYEGGRWFGALMIAAMPLLNFLALGRSATRKLRTSAITMSWLMLALFVLVGAFAALGSDNVPTPQLIGLALFITLCCLNIWSVARLRRLQGAGDDDAADLSLRRFWRGDLPLGIAFWVGALLVTLLQCLMLAGIGLFADGLSIRAGAILTLTAFTLSALLLLLYAAGVWHTAIRRGRDRPGFRALMAKASVGAVVLGFAFLASTSLRGPLLEHAMIALGKDPLAPLQARITTNGTVLLLHGTFGTGSADQVRRVLARSPDIRTVALSSSGGRLREAAEIARLVRERKLDTYVDTRCESACTFVFLAGKERAATPNARIGFHRPSFAGVSALGFDPATEGMLATYRDAGIPQDFLERVAATHAQDMWYPSPKQLEAAGVINRVSLGGEISAIGFIAGSSRQELEAAFRNVPMMVAMERHFPGTIAAAVQAAWMERNQGGTDSAVGNAARDVVGARYPKILAAANDSSLDVFARIMVDEMRAAQAISTEACRLLLAGELNIAQVLSSQLVQREHDWALQVLRAKSLVERKPVDEAEFQRTMAGVTALLPGEVMDVIADLPKYRDEPGRQCSATIALYDRIVDLPPEQRHLLLRGMFQAGAF
jgi:hypothetical protein